MLAYCNLDVVIHIFKETKAKILACGGCLKIKFFNLNKHFQKSTHAIAGPHHSATSLTELALDPGVPLHSAYQLREMW